MKKLMILLLLLFLSTVSIAQEVSEEQQKMKNLLTKMESVSVSVFSLGDNGMGTCTGVVLTNESDSATVLTAKHCTGVFEEIYVEEELVDYVVESVDDDLAVLVLKTNIPNKVPVKLAKKNASLLQIVYNYGYPAFETHVSVGYVYRRTLDWYFMKIKVIPGCSGGGIFNENGELVGDVWGGFRTSDVAIMEPISDVKRFLNKIKMKYEQN
jgi:S1-C subfamily serine protease